MKKKSFVSLFLVLAMSWVSEVSFAQITVENENGVSINYSFLYEGLEVEVTAINPPYSGKIVIPEEIVYEDQTYTVTGIGENAFFNCRNLTSVILPNSIRSIKNQAFYNCSNLKSVNIPDNVLFIGISAFSGCI